MIGNKNDSGKKAILGQSPNWPLLGGLLAKLALFVILTGFFGFLVLYRYFKTLNQQKATRKNDCEKSEGG